jgi:DNA-binding MarR family transcriptional regulator
MPQAKIRTQESAEPATGSTDAELDLLVSALYDVSNLARTLARRTTAGDPLEPAATRVLVVVHRLGATRASGLACELHLDLSTVSRHIGALARDGHLVIEPDPADGRAQLISLSESGEAVLQQVYANRRAAIGSVIADWPDADTATLTDLLRRLAHDMAVRSNEGPVTS